MSYLLKTKPTYHQYLKGEQISKEKNRLIKQTLPKEEIQVGNEQVEARGFIRNTKVNYIWYKRVSMKSDCQNCKDMSWGLEYS